MSKLFTWRTETICEHFQFVHVCVGVFLFTAYIINKLQDTSRELCTLSLDSSEAKLLAGVQQTVYHF